MEPTIAIFTFNTEAQIYCGNVTNTESKCVPSDFVVEYVNYVCSENNNLLPDIFVINLQETSITNPFKMFKTDNLPKRFESCIKNIDNSYVAIKKKIKGVGREGLRGLCSCVIASKKLNIKYKHELYRPIFKSSVSVKDGQQYGKGAILTHIHFVKNSKSYEVKFINTHLPFTGKSTDNDVRNKTLIETLQYFNCETNDCDKFIIGDLNYRVDFNKDSALTDTYIQSVNNLRYTTDFDTITQFVDEYKKYDQLYNAITTIFPQFLEGVNNNGPCFLPTCKMNKICPILFNRDYQIVKKNRYRIPSWCDRILYTNNISCMTYNSFDNGYTCKSDHVPVTGLYNLKTPSNSKPDNFMIQLSSI